MKIAYRERCRICNRQIVYDDWEIGDRRLCVMCAAEYGEPEEEEEGEENVNDNVINSRCKRD